MKLSLLAISLPPMGDLLPSSESMGLFLRRFVVSNLRQVIENSPPLSVKHKIMIFLALCSIAKEVALRSFCTSREIATNVCNTFILRTFQLDGVAPLDLVK